MVSSGRRDPPNGVALEELSICSAENFSGDGEGRALALNSHPEGTEKSLESSRPRSNRARLSAALPNCGRTVGNHSSRVSLEIRYDRVYEPYGVAPAARDHQG